MLKIILVILIYYIIFVILMKFLIDFYLNEIEFQMFYFTLFLRFTFVIALWIVQFGTMSYSIYWMYNEKEYEVLLPSINR